MGISTPPLAAKDKPVPNGKKVQLNVQWVFDKYKVVSITNTTVVKPGQLLDVAWVQDVCDNYSNWEVTMVDNDIGAQVLNFVRGIIPIPALAVGPNTADKDHG